MSHHVIAAVQEGPDTLHSIYNVRGSPFTCVAEFNIPHAVHTALPHITRVLTSWEDNIGQSEGEELLKNKHWSYSFILSIYILFPFILYCLSNKRSSSFSPSIVVIRWTLSALLLLFEGTGHSGTRGCLNNRLRHFIQLEKTERALFIYTSSGVCSSCSVWVKHQSCITENPHTVNSTSCRTADVVFLYNVPNLEQQTDHL